MEKELTVNNISYRIVCLLGKGKGGYSYLADSDGQPVVIKQIHHEPCDYYTFGNKIEAELRDYERLQKAGIRIPRMQAVDRAGAGHGGKGHGSRAEHRLLPDQLCCA